MESYALRRAAEAHKDGILQYNIGVFGTRVGKSSLVARLMGDSLPDDWDSTIEETHIVRVTVDGQPASLAVLDTAGLEGYQGLWPHWMSQCDGFLLVYAVNSDRSFKHIADMYKFIRRIKDETAFSAVLCGNKCDMESKRQVTKQQGEELAKSWDVPFIETSAKERINHYECFHELVRQMKQSWGIQKKPRNDSDKKSKTKGGFGGFFGKVYKGWSDGRKQKKTDDTERKYDEVLKEQQLETQRELEKRDRERKEWEIKRSRIQNTEIIRSYFRGAYQRKLTLIKLNQTKDAVKLIWSAYRRYRLESWMDERVIERQNKKSIFDADIIYVLEIGIIRGYHLESDSDELSFIARAPGLNTFVEIKCENKTFRSKEVKNAYNPEWNDSVQFHYRQQPQKISFEVFTDKGYDIGDYDMDLDPVIFKPYHRGFSGIVKLRDVVRGEIEIKVNGRIMEPSTVAAEFAMLSAMDNNDDLVNEESRKQIMDKYLSEKRNINKIMLDAKKHLPLHLLDKQMIHDRVKHWIINDINYESHLMETIKLFTKHSLSGKVINLTSINNCKKIIYQDLIQFMTEKTIDIMFDEFDNYKKQNQNEVQSMAASQVAYIMFNYPLQRLLRSILSEQIDGQSFINRYQNNDKWIKKQTGWSNDSIYQIEAVIFRDLSMTKEGFIANMDEIMNRKKTISDTFKSKIRSKIMEFDVESICYRMKNNIPIVTFRDSIMTLIDELNIINQEYKQYNNENAYYGDDFIPKLYSMIASFFIYKNLNRNRFTIESKQWICCNCNNRNYSRFINRKQQYDMSICSLCGIEQIESIILNLRSYDTFSMINKGDNVNESESKQKNEDRKDDDDIEELIGTVMSEQGFDLKCPNRNDNQPCPAILRLTKHLIIYKRWLQSVYQKTQGKDNIDNTVQVNLKSNIDGTEYEQILIDTIKYMKYTTLTNDIRESLLKMVNNNMGNISEIDTFLNAESRKAYALIFKKHANVKPLWGYKIYAQVNKKLKSLAQAKKYGESMRNLQMDQVDHDYYHILKIHINQGNRTTIKNVFKYFSTIIHHNDSTKQEAECRSIERRKERVNRLGNASKTSPSSQDKSSINHHENKDIWTLNQTYNQSQLDMIHTYLCHSNWKERVNRYIQQEINQQKEEKDNEEDYELEDVDTIKTIHNENMAKYVTSSYGFGVDHSHPHLPNIYPSLRDELLFNKLHPIDESTFCNLLIKAIKIHQIALKHYNDELICKYYQKEFNIIRNDPIGLCHILALIIYTDLSQFCTVYRQTYRKLHGETTAKQVENRHKELYFFSRYLFESIEFYGSRMKTNLTVYHGLSVVLHFGQFTAYFNQPISTTTNLTTAHQFSQQKGIILALKSDTDYKANNNRVPKFLSVSWLSAYPNEDEKLFYGAYVRFKISDIIEGATLQTHSIELNIFNTFQQLLNNFDVNWNQNAKKGQIMIHILTTLIRDGTKAEDPRISEYGRDLFDYFCKHQDRKQITIRNFRLLPTSIYESLFVEEKKLSFSIISNVFPYLMDLTLNNLEIGRMIVNIETYLSTIENFIQAQEASKPSNLSKITLESEKQQDRKINAVLKKYDSKLIGSNIQWRIQYIPRSQDDGIIHSIVFSKHDNLNEQDQMVVGKEIIKSYSNDQLLHLIENICNESDKLYNFKQNFMSYFKQNNIDGLIFASYHRKGFGQKIVDYFDNKKLRGSSQNLYSRILKECKQSVSIPKDTGIVTEETKQDELSANNEEKKEEIVINQPDQHIEDVPLFNEGIIANCNEQQMIAFARNICDKDDKLKTHKGSMISWIQRNNLNGDGFLKYNAGQFARAIASESTDARLNRAGYNLYQQLFELNKGIHASRFTDYMGIVDERIKDKISNIDSFDTIADSNGIVPVKMISLLLMELSNTTVSSDDTHDTLFIIEMAKIWDKLIDVDGNGNILTFEWVSCMNKLGVDALNNKQLEQLFDLMDVDHDAVIEKNDFILFAAMAGNDSNESSKLQSDLIQSLIQKYQLT